MTTYTDILLQDTNGNYFIPYGLLPRLGDVSITNPTQGQNLTYDAINQVWKNTSTSATIAWGGITGALSDQSDLVSALNNKYDASNPSGFITGITSSDVITALGYTPYNSSNPNGYTSNVGTVTKVNNTSPDSNGNVTISIPSAQVNSDWNATSGVAEILNKPTIPTVNNATLTITQGGVSKGTFTANASSDVTIALDAGSSITVDQTYDGTSINAQSGVAIAGAGFLKNAGTGTNSLALLGTATGNRGVGLGQASEGGGAYATGLGTGAKATGNYAIQIGYGTNSTAHTLSIGFNASSSANRKNWELLDGITGLIPKERLPFLGRNIGEIVTSTIPLTDAGLHLLDGSLISGTGAYADFVTYIAGLVSTYPDLFETEANWQTAVTTYGVCGKFVYDSVNNTVRLPKITGIVEGTTDLTALGDLVQAGLPNITGTLNAIRGGGDTTATSAFEITSSTSAGSYSSSTTNVKKDIKFDASLSDSIYGSSTTVQPQTIKVLYYIVVATSSKTDIQVDIDEIATDLNGKADTNLSNVPTSKGILSESYVNGTSWYRVYSDGWCEQGGINEVSSTSTVVSLLKNYINNNYSVMAQGYRDTYNSSNTTNIQLISKTTSQINIACATSTTSIGWQACGYIR